MRPIVLACALLTASACMVQSQPQVGSAAATGAVPGRYIASANGQSAELILQPDGTGTIDGYPGTWSVQDGQLYLSDGQSYVAATLQGNQLVLHLPDGPVAFTRVAPGGGPVAGGGYPATGGNDYPATGGNDYPATGGNDYPAGAPAPGGSVNRPATARPFTPEKTLPGDAVAPDGTGASFTVPRDWQHGPTRGDDGSEAYGINPPGPKGEGGIMLTRAVLGAAEQQQPVTALLRQVIQGVVGDLPVTQVVAPEELEIAGQRAARSIVRGTVNGRELELYIAGVVVEHYGFVIVSLYPVARADTLRPGVETVLASFRGSLVAENTELKARLVGCWEDYTYSGGNAGTGSFTRRIGFEQDGTYSMRTFSSVNAGGGSVSSDSREQGRYRVEGQSLVTMSDKGEASTYAVQFQGGRLYLGSNKHLPCSR